ncbi:lamin tail domain-containing protein [Chitinophaga horti]|uniref:Lamin tail domain-containing protein n=1 Tax=Chitinophaga horti TaxID=2920382 RepID=A0ABY6J1S5_9BACT|nr:lamin tail domain-containing protein [Chitinophaga horti]UYQ92587.1 lamin tail domain-containing protein [Chitinophaga horti]
MLTRIVCALLCAPLLAYGQFSENFNVSGMHELPAWKGSDSSWTITNGVLKSVSNRANATFYLSRQATTPTEVQWEWWIRLDFNTSSTNYADVFLVADDDSLPAAAGYFVRIGNTQDEVSLYRKTRNGTITKLIDGRDGSTAATANELMVKVTRTANNEWQLFTSPPDGRFTKEGKMTDTATLQGGYFGLLVRQSTSGFWGKHYFDSIACAAFVPDTNPPLLVQLEVRDSQHIFVLFSETPDSLNVKNFSPLPAMLSQDVSTPGGYLLYYDTPFVSTAPFAFTINNVRDEVQLIMPALDTSLVYYRPQRYDIVMNEIFADPSPSVGLPTFEYVELYNRSDYPIRLDGWRFFAGEDSVILPPYRLPADSFVVLCSAGKFNRALTIAHFPTLGNEQDNLGLYDAAGSMMHAVSYTKEWYQSDLRKEGGWSLEMIDANAACSGQANWKASTALLGGTPGQVNAVAGLLSEQQSPAIVELSTPDSLQLHLAFNYVLDSIAVSIAGMATQAVASTPPAFLSATITLPEALRTGRLYDVQLISAKSCSGLSPTNESFSFGLPEPAVAGGVIINEVLFNPPPGVEDFVELFNSGKQVIDLSQLYLANRKADGSLDNITRIAAERQLLPGGYVALTGQRLALCRQYACKAVRDVIQLPIPSFPDDAGTVVLLDRQGTVLDEFAYSEKQHFPLITNREGISLERLSDQTPATWHSAASQAGHATPGYVNSQQSAAGASTTAFSVTPEVFSPDNDGRDDLAFIHYNFTAPGKVANITVFDAAGRRVCLLARNHLLGNTGRLTWNGLSDAQEALPVGAYVIYAEVFDAAGRVERWRLPVMLGRGWR